MAGETCLDSRASSHDRAVTGFQVRPSRNLVFAVGSDEKMREEMTRQTLRQRYAQAQALHCMTSKVTTLPTIRRVKLRSRRDLQRREALRNNTVVGRDRRAIPPKRNKYNSHKEFQIGPLIDRIFSLYLQRDHGPDESSQEMPKADIDMQLEWVRNGRSITRTGKSACRSRLPRRQF